MVKIGRRKGGRKRMRTVAQRGDVVQFGRPRALIIRKGHCVLRARAKPETLDVELASYEGDGDGDFRHRFRFSGWERIAELIYALEQAARGELLNVVQWFDQGNQTVAMIFFRLEDYGGQDLKGRIYFRLGRAVAGEGTDFTDQDRTRVRLTRLEVHKLKTLAQMALFAVS